uniref:Uncharacterized protein n=1 Tax=Arundo donax TaxID=35708 RepID=A0A0A9CS23_ARUDO
MFRPRLPAFSDISITLTSGTVLNSFTALSLMLRDILPSSLLNCIWLLLSESSSKSNIPVHWVKTIALTGATSLGIDFVLMTELMMSTAALIFEEM